MLKSNYIIVFKARKVSKSAMKKDSPLRQKKICSPANQIQIHVKETRKPADFFGRSWPSSSTSKKPEFKTGY
ncbi:hypothetical protein V6N11_038253 [Hibiscus sabdariffa]|uniref:Uncharacterized protein n=1 Tax=Hibiscus sabdariffa TaxID=183260 RepID=A0ABR2SKD5_9ROSI